MANDPSTIPYLILDSSRSERLGGIRAFGLAIVAFAFLFTLLYSPVIFTGHLICPEIQSLNALFGDKALWTPYIYSGMPFEPDPGTQFFYPPMWLFYAISGPGHWNGTVWNIYIMLPYILCGAFCFSYVRLLTNSNFASAVAGFAYAFGHLTVQVTGMPILHAAIWLTAGLLAFELLAREISGKNYLFAVLAVAFTGLAGQPQIFSYALALWTLYVLVRASMLGENGGLRFGAIALVGITLGTLVSFAHLFQTLDLAAGSARSNFTFADFLTYAINPLQVIGVFLPYIYGGAPDGIFNQPHFGNFLCWNQDIYLGFIIMFLSLTMISAFFRDRMVLFWAVIGIGTFLLSFGNATPLAWIFYHIPPFGKFRGLFRLLIVYSLANAVLAGLCIATIEQNKLPKKKLARVMTVLAALFFTAVALIPAIGDVLKDQSKQHGIPNLGVLPWTNPSIGIPCLLIIASIATCLLFEKNQKVFARVALALVLVCDLGLTSWYSFNALWRIEAPKASDLNPPATATKYVPLANANYNRILTVRGGSSSLDELKPNLTQMWHVPTASGYGPLMPTRYGELLNMTEGGFLIPPWNYQPEDRCFDLLSVKYATAAKDDTRLEKIIGVGGSNWRKLEEIGTASVHENLHPLPRTWLTQEIIRLQPAQILRAIKTSKLPTGKTFDPLKTALLEEIPADFAKRTDNGADITTAGNSTETGSSSSATITGFTETSLSIDAQASASSLIVLSNPFYSGWIAKVDDKLTPVLRTDYIIQGVIIPAGKHHVVFEYSPPSMFTAIAIGASGLIAALLMALFLSKRKTNM